MPPVRTSFFLRDGLGITYTSIAVNLVLGALKVAAGLLGQSRALVADGLHSLIDLSTDVAVVLGLLIARRPEDAAHLYGHHKFASLANVVIAFAILAFSVALVVSSVAGLDADHIQSPNGFTLWVAVLSLFVKEALFFATRAVAVRLRSRLILANAWHHRTDSVSSLLTALAIGVAHFGGPEWRIADTLMGVALGGFLAFEGLKLFLRGINDLVDRAPEEALVDDLREHILPVHHAIAYHNFRARRVGDLIEVDLHLQVTSSLSVAEGHEVARTVRQAMMSQHPEILDVLIHVEPATPRHLKHKGISEIP